MAEFAFNKLIFQSKPHKVASPIPSFPIPLFKAPTPLPQLFQPPIWKIQIKAILLKCEFIS